VVTHHDAASDGWVLFTSGHATAAFLIDRAGRVVHQWHLPFREAFPEHGEVPDPVPESHIHWSDAHLYPNGDLLALYAADGDTPYGYGLVKVDRDSNVLWTYDGRAHHDFDVQPDGTIWTLTHDFRKVARDPIPGPGANDSSLFLEDVAVELSPQGDERRRLPLVDLVAEYDHQEVLTDWFYDEVRWDWLHANDIDVVGEDFAEHHAFAEAGDLMFSSRSLDAVGWVDPDRSELTRITRGFWRKQHDPDPMPDGDVMVFDNQGDNGPAGPTRIAEFAPSTTRLDWQYTGTAEQPFDSTWWGKQTPLENGHVLVADSLQGRIFEVTRAGRIVWEWRTPTRVEFGGESFVPTIKGPVEHIDPSELEFDPARPSDQESRLHIDGAERFGR
jgi:hypothetical protein